MKLQTFLIEQKLNIRQWGDCMKQPKTKYIIRNYTDIYDLKLIKYIEKVMELGFVSETNAHGKQYCFHTSFLCFPDKLIAESRERPVYMEVRTIKPEELHISVHKRNNTYTFYVYKRGDLD